MDAKKGLSSIISKKIKESPLASNIILGLFLLVSEKMLDSEFLCPCCEGKAWNSLFVSIYFLCPGSTASVLMYFVHKHGSSISFRFILRTLVPLLTWVIILLLDGRYLACGMTNWSGIYEATDGSGLLRWCKPNNNSSERLSYTHKAYTISQCIGLLLCIPFGLTVSCCLIIPISKTNQEGTNLESCSLKMESAPADQIPS